MDSSSDAHGRHRCAACFRQFNKMEHLVEHMRAARHSGHEPRCDICRKHCRSFEALRDHLGVGGSTLPKAAAEGAAAASPDAAARRRARAGLQDGRRRQRRIPGRVRAGVRHRRAGERPVRGLREAAPSRDALPVRDDGDPAGAPPRRRERDGEERAAPGGGAAARRRAAVEGAHQPGQGAPAGRPRPRPRPPRAAHGLPGLPQARHGHVPAAHEDQQAQQLAPLPHAQLPRLRDPDGAPAPLRGLRRRHAPLPQDARAAAPPQGRRTRTGAGRGRPAAVPVVEAAGAGAHDARGPPPALHAGLPLLVPRCVACGLSIYLRQRLRASPSAS
uniref:C2H2-type domain-containing protein n=1 Tax=Zea mays TaxID=4577 RepID=A0A804N136_MAIZE